MKTKIFILVVFSAFIINIAFAQKKNLTIEQAAYYYWFQLYPDHLTKPQWQINSHNFSYISDDYSALILVSEKNNFNNDTILTISDIDKSVGLTYFYDYQWITKDTILFQNNNKLLAYDINKKKVIWSVVLDDKAKNIYYNLQANKIAYTIDNNLYISDTKGNSIAITNDTNKGIVNGSDYVHRQEFGINKGIFWSPKGNYIAFYRKDETMVYDYPLVDFTQFPAKTKLIKYPMTGQKSEEVTLGIYDVKNNKTIFLKKKGDPEHYLTCITWDPSEKYIYIAELNRDQNKLQINKYDISTGKKIKTLFKEKNNKYVEPEHPLYFLPKSKDKFLWFSERDGYQHLYLYNTNGKLIKQLTKGPWVVTEFLGFSKDEKYVYFQATKESPVQRHIYKVSLENGKITDLTKEEGWHEAIFSDDGKLFLDTYSSLEVPNIIKIKNYNAEEIKEFLNSPNYLEDYNMPEIKIKTIKAADGKSDLYYRLILPPDFDPHKKYPAIVYVYGGPHVQLIEDSWLGGASAWQIYMAEKGYVMFTLDSRGSDNRGFDFESVTFRHLGIEEAKDQKKGVEFLKSLPYIDTNRLGIHGWSFGGFMTLTMLTTYPNLFKVGVAGGPVTDWKYYEVMYGERYMDTPETNPEGYKQSSVINKIDRLKAKTLIIHGLVDPVVVPQNSMDLLLKAQQNSIQIDFYPYPNSEHNVRGKLRIHLMKKITDYFDENL